MDIIVRIDAPYTVFDTLNERGRGRICDMTLAELNKGSEGFAVYEEQAHLRMCRRQFEKPVVEITEGEWMDAMSSRSKFKHYGQYYDKESFFLFNVLSDRFGTWYIRIRDDKGNKYFSCVSDFYQRNDSVVEKVNATFLHK